MEILRKTAVFRIEQQTKDLPPGEVTNIALSDVPLMPERLACFNALTHLTLVSMKPNIKALQAVSLASFPSLRMLDVSDNAITVTDGVPKCVSVKKLFIANNRIAQWEEIERLAAAFPELEVLDLTANAVDDASRFNDVFALFPNLAAFDSRNADGEEVVVADTDESSSSVEEDETTDDSFISADEDASAGEHSADELDSAKDVAPPAKAPRFEK